MDAAGKAEEERSTGVVGARVLTEEQVNVLAAGRQAGRSCASLAEEFGVGETTVRRYLREQGWVGSSRDSVLASFTAAQTAQLAARRTAGESAVALAKELGVSVRTLRRHLHRTGWSGSGPGGTWGAVRALTDAQVRALVGRRQAGASTADLAEAFGVSAATVKRYLRTASCPAPRRDSSKPLALTDEEAAQLVARRGAGIPMKDLAEEFGVSVATVRTYLYRAGHVSSGGRFALSDEQAAEVVSRYQAGELVADLAEEFGVSKTTVYRCLDRNGQR